MSRNYDNWERLVAAVLKRELIWKLCHEDSTTSSLASSSPSLSSDFTSSFRLFSAASSSRSVQFFPFFDPAHDLALPFQHLAGIKITWTNKVRDQAGRIVHFNNSPSAFGLQELLIAPSYVLGDEVKTFRNTLIVRLNEQVTFVAKRLDRGKFSQLALEQRVEKIGSIEHDNVLKLRGCYLSQDDNFVFFDYSPQGSVHTMLHERRKSSANYVCLDWRWRMRIAVGAARGLAHIHRQFGGSFIHGNVKSSNIFLDSRQHICVSDIAPTTCRTSKYDPASEVGGLKRIDCSQASDVYSFGVLLIELISGRSPCHYRNDGRCATLADWAVHNMRDEWRAMVFDKELLKDSLGMQGMWDMLLLAASCVEKEPMKRPNMDDVEGRLDFMLHYFSA